MGRGLIDIGYKSFNHCNLIAIQRKYHLVKQIWRNHAGVVIPDSSLIFR